MNNASICITNMQPYMYNMQQVSTDVVNFTRTVAAQDWSIEKIMSWGASTARDWWAHEQFTNLSNSKWLVPALAVAVGYRVGYLRGRTQCRDMILWNLCAMVADVKDQTSDMREMLSTKSECPDRGNQTEEEIFSILDCIDVCNRQLDDNCKGVVSRNTCRRYKHSLKKLCENVDQSVLQMISEYGTTHGDNWKQVHEWIGDLYADGIFLPKKASWRSAVLKAFPEKNV